MRIIHITKITGIAGSENHLLTLLAGLRKRGHDARFLLLVEPGNPVEAFGAAAEGQGIPVERLTIYHHADVTLFARLWRRLRALRPDIVHTHLLHADMYGIPAARFAGARAVVTSRHNDNAFRRRVPYRQINRALWGMADAGIAISSAIARFSTEVEGAPVEKMHTVLYGLEPATQAVDRDAARAALREELALPDSTLLLGMVCRLIEQKGIPYALEAFQSVAQAFPQAHVVIAGDGPLRPMLAAQAAALGLDDRVHFLGWRTDAAQVFAALDVFLMPSLWEGFGLVLLEAMAQRVPVVGSAVSAIPEVVADGESGILCAPRDVAALAAAMQRLLADPDLRGRMGEAGYQRLQSLFNPTRMVDETVAIYEKLLAEAG